MLKNGMNTSNAPPCSPFKRCLFDVCQNLEEAYFHKLKRQAACQRFAAATTEPAVYFSASRLASRRSFSVLGRYK